VNNSRLAPCSATLVSVPIRTRHRHSEY